MKEEHIDLLCQFIPIVLLFLYLGYPQKMNTWSVSILGKLVALSLIVFYTLIDRVYGAVVCGIIILYYHQFYVEGLETLTDTLRSQFKSQNCQNGKLVYKNMDVKSDMAAHIFPEIQYKTTPCNPCDDSCLYDIREEKR
jgi:hypothetical protein